MAAWPVGCGPGHFTHAAAPNQLLGGGTQRLRLVLQVGPWRGVGLGLVLGVPSEGRAWARAGVVGGAGVGQNKGLEKGPGKGLGVDPGLCIYVHTPKEARE